MGWLVGQGHPVLKNFEFVNWDDEIPNIFMGKLKIDGNQTTHQMGHELAFASPG